MAKTKSRLNGNNSGIGNIVHSIRNIMRRDPGVDGDFDFYKITFPVVKSGTMTNTITKGEDKEKEIFEIIENNPSLSAEQIAEMVGLSTIGARYHINNLKKKCRIKRKGHGKGGSWEILN